MQRRHETGQSDNPNNQNRQNTTRPEARTEWTVADYRRDAGYTLGGDQPPDTNSPSHSDDDTPRERDEHTRFASKIVDARRDPDSVLAQSREKEKK